MKAFEARAKEEADKLVAERGYSIVEDAGRGYRRVVASPKPQAIVEIESIRDMVEAGLGGSIINTSSVGGQRVGDVKEHPNAPYHAAKAGLDQFTRYLSCELGDAGIRVNAIAPGPIHSDLDADLPQSFKDMIYRDMPVHRFGEPIEIGAYAVFLASDAARFITGTVNVMDGGLMCVKG